MRGYGVAVRKTRTFRVNSDAPLVKGRTKKVLKAWVSNLGIGALALLALFAFALLLYKAYTFVKLKVEVSQLLKEKKELSKVYNGLVSESVLKQKAKEFGLRPPTKEDIIRLR